MIALYADERTPEGKEAIEALASIDHAHVSTSGGRPYAVWDRACFKGLKQIRALGDTLRVCNALRVHCESLIESGADRSWTPIS